jgi:hypothetical protein
MPPSGMVEALDVIEHVGFRLLTCAYRFGEAILDLHHDFSIPLRAY